MAKQFLHGTNVITILKEMGGEGVAEGMAGNAFLDFCLASGFLDCAL
jgi:hypothetical protein